MQRFAFPRFEFIGRFARNRGALVGACLILVVALMAVFASVFFPTDPLRIVGPPVGQRRQHPRQSHEIHGEIGG